MTRNLGDIQRILDVERLGLATYFLALVYGILAVSASFKFARISKVRF
jgi:hypothetical protein